jgi:hypothetical protein
MMYYKIRQPGNSFTQPEQWMRTIIKELWVFSITIWKQRNSELHGTEQWLAPSQWKNGGRTQPLLGNVCQTDSVVLHHSRIEEILNWTKEHLDAYLASAADLIVIEQRNERARLILSFLSCLAGGCGVDRESYGVGRCSVLVLLVTGIFKFLFPEKNNLTAAHPQPFVWLPYQLRGPNSMADLNSTTRPLQAPPAGIGVLVHEKPNNRQPDL